MLPDKLPREITGIEIGGAIKSSLTKTQQTKREPVLT